MKYHVNFQYLPKGALRPIDDGDTVPLEIAHGKDPSLLPAVGDYVQIQYPGGDRVGFSGKVRSRLFMYLAGIGDDRCAVNIVVEETEGDDGKLIKE